MSETDMNGPSRPLIAIVQYEPVLGDVLGNRQLSLEKVEEAARAGAKIVVLPECCLTGLIFDERRELWDLAEMTDGKSVSAWRALSEQLGVYIVAGMVERDGEKLHNTATVTTPGGELIKYRKTHVFGRERKLFDLGSELVCFDTEWGRAGIVICYDLWFPEITRALAKAGASLIVSPSNWFVPPRQASDMSNAPSMAFSLATAAACANEVTIACSDRIGLERGIEFIGGSFVIGPNGRPIAGPLGRDEAGMLLCPWPDNSTVRGLVQSHLTSRRDDLYAMPVVLR